MDNSDKCLKLRFKTDPKVCPTTICPCFKTFIFLHLSLAQERLNTRDPQLKQSIVLVKKLSLV